MNKTSCDRAMQASCPLARDVNAKCRKKKLMARGWESKSVESQIEEGGRRESGRETRSRDELERTRRLDSLELSRRSLARDLETAQTETHRAALQNALNFIEAELRKLG